MGRMACVSLPRARVDRLFSEVNKQVTTTARKPVSISSYQPLDPQYDRSGRSSSGKLAITMSADALELVFTGSAVLGTALLLLSSIGAGMHVRLHVPFRT